MVEIIIALVCVIFLFSALCICIAVSDKWIDAVGEFNRHLSNENDYLSSEIDDLKDDIAKLKAKNDVEELE